MRLPVYAAVTSLAISLFVVGGVFAVRPRKADPPKLALPHPLILESASGQLLSKSVVELHQNLLVDAMEGNLAAAQKCLDVGADVNVFETDSKWRTPLTVAAENGEVEMTRFLLEHGADPNAGGVIYPPLVWTIMNNDSDKGVECIRLLLEKGADPSHPSFDDVLPVELAVDGGNVRVVKLLFERMPKLDEYDRRKYLKKVRNVALCKAAEEGTLNRVRQLVADGADVNYVNEVENSPLMGAVSCGSVPIMNYLLGQGAKVNLRNMNGKTALMNAGNLDGIINAENAKLVNDGGEIAKILLQHGAKLELHDTSKMTALLYAARGNSRALRVMLNYGVRANVQDEDGNTPLYYAAKARDAESVELLLRHGADVDAQNKAGETALMFASVNPDEEAPAQERKKLKLLRQFEADEKLKDNEGQTAKDYASLQDVDFIQGC